MFFSFDGIDGTGKSTQMDLFCEWLQAKGADVVFCRDPGSTPLGEKLRSIVLHSDDATPIDARAEMLLYMAARAELVEEVIRPSLASGKVVVSDRYLLANIAYQGYAGGLEVETIRHVGQIATDGIVPDCIFLLDMPPEMARERLGNELDRMESRGDGYQRRLRKGYLQEATEPEHHIFVIDATGSIDEIHARICKVAKPLLSDTTATTLE